MTRRYVLHTPVLRSAHLERLAPLDDLGVALEVSATDRHPDLDDALLARSPVPVVLAPLAATEAGLRADPPAVLEVTEPAWAAHWPDARRLAAAARAGAAAAGRPAPLVAAYVIDNLPPRDPVPDADLLDAVAFGTADAAAVYAAAWPDAAARWTARTVEERRPRCGCLPADVAVVDAAREVVFCAELSERKGVDVLQAAWPAVAADRPGWRLRLLGYGPRVAAVGDWVRERVAGGADDVALVVDADRATVHAALRRAAVLVLPSRRVEGWREQVGLSLVEGLAHGCRVVTTTETGLARGLAAEGHVVVAPDDPRALADGLRTALAPAGAAPLRKALPPAGVAEDSRQRTVRWLAGLPAPAARSAPS